MTPPLRCLLADDHTLVRAGLRALLERLPAIEVVGEAGDGVQAVQLASRLKPDLVLMDIAMAGMSGLEAAERLRQELPSTRVIILSMYASEEYVLQALRAGAAGYLLKDAATGELALAVEAVRQGGAFLSPTVSRLLTGSSGSEDDAEATGADKLTPRQRQVLKLLAEGKAVKEAAFLLNISVKTVETHRAQLMDRLGIHDLPGLVRYAMRTGLVPTEPAG